jgi:ribonuclease P protein component
VVLAAARAPGEAASGPGETQFVRLGVTVSRRVGGAVVRNRVKRRLREWFRTSRVRAVGAVDLVVIARPAAATLTSEALRRELDGLCGRLLGGREA